MAMTAVTRETVCRLRRAESWPEWIRTRPACSVAWRVPRPSENGRWLLRPSAADQGVAEVEVDFRIVALDFKGLAEVRNPFVNG
jgi:hypothetical protein